MFLKPYQTGIPVLKSLKRQGANGPLEKIGRMGYVFSFKGTQTIPRDSREPKSDPNGIQDPTWSFNGPYRDPKIDLMIFEKNPGFVYYLYILHSLAPLNILEHFFGHCGTLPGPRGPSWTIMDLKMDPARKILGDPW